jgi:NADH/NAD ratio-sensing transcriptional regulator Rex
MKLIVALLFALISISSSAQVYIGLTEDELISKVKPTEKYTKSTTEDGTRQIAIQYTHTKNAYVRMYYFNKNTGKCFLYVVEPLTDAAQNAFAEQCNEQYVVVGTKRWRTYIRGFTVRVDLVYVDDLGKNFFYFNIEQEPNEQDQ